VANNGGAPVSIPISAHATSTHLADLGIEVSAAGTDGVSRQAFE
jgi:hypothetical protein